MLQSLRNIWEIPDLRKRILFTLGLLAIYRLGSHVPTPGINAKALIMWLGEQITERGIGNGMSLIIFAGIVVGFPRGLIDTFSMIHRGELSLLAALLLVAAMVVVVGAIIFMERGQRRITVQYAKRVVGRRLAGGQTTHLPLRGNTSGGIPVIFSSSIIAFPNFILSRFKSNNPWMPSGSQQL